MEDGIKLGGAAFANMMFTLKTPVTPKNHKDYKFMEYEMNEIAPEIWAMPVYMTDDDDFSLFFIVTKIATGETVMAFATGAADDQGEFQLSQPMNTGLGLNKLNEHDHDRAENVLHFLNQISKANEGNWRMVQA
ncbi:hypothetical protein M3M39_02770 [Fructilactobacillus hinvesii]|uniref:Uncharacterized protein n=1 Tax=Fructilactobacillus hinvesii TaxID=2940300 RepID=A0ABY5BTG9_9LACO|nr:hypothetical protein [Fructilactobacillus hinvesii]USS88420.1 hypothetical protein M3M39_02770 [Fructilactobacillus hinvesii]